VENLIGKSYLIAFGKNLSNVRKQQGFTQEKLANDLGVEISQISRIERGVINTSIGSINEIAKVLGVETYKLFQI